MEELGQSLDVLGLQFALACEDLGHDGFGAEYRHQVLLTQLSLYQQRLHKLDAMYSRNHNAFALPAFYQPTEQCEISFLRRRPLVHGEQLPDLVRQMRKICFGFDSPRSVRHPSSVLVMYGSVEAYLHLVVLCTCADGNLPDRPHARIIRASDAKLPNAIIPWTQSLCRLGSSSTNQP